MINTKNVTVIMSDIIPSKMRLDKAILQLFSGYSRTCVKKWIVNCQVNVNDVVFNKPNTKVICGDKITVNNITSVKNVDNSQNIPLNIVYEDEDILVINKQVDLVVHPGPGHEDGTLLNALLYKDSCFFNVPRSGIVHRLDKNTTGLMVIAKNIKSYDNLVSSMKSRKIVRQYEAVVHGRVISGGTICKPIKRHPLKRTSMTTSVVGKRAITHYRVIKRFYCHTHLVITLETGRTHQIRVHMLSINHPLIGDRVYGNKHKFCKNVVFSLRNTVRSFPRQALHASKLSLEHPIKKVRMEWNSNLPQDISILLNQLNVSEDKLTRSPS
ncbi:MAG: 23S rRNA pseudouridine(1911/1915/1917) synthase RluD [Buchnera aphidicola (Kaburagia rhusicola rhusicola)]